MPDAPSHKTTIAVVDSNARHIAVFTEALDPFYRVMAFSDSEDALDWLRTNRPSALLLDEDVQPLSGTSTIEALFRMPAARRPPVIGVAAEQTSPFLDLARRRGAEATLVKPLHRAGLIRAVSDRINALVETSWDDYESTPRVALKTAAKLFAELQARFDGAEEPIPFDLVNEAGTALIKAVKFDRVGDVLYGLRFHDNYPFVHCLRVAALLAKLGLEMKLGSEDLATLTAGGLLHDIGKLAIPYPVLNKPGGLSYEDTQLMKSHVARAAQILNRSTDLPRGVRMVVEQHHEKLDGTGYPRGLFGDQVNDLARMAAIADIFCALTDRRPYKAAMAAKETVTVMQDMGFAIDVRLLATFTPILVDPALGSGHID